MRLPYRALVAALALAAAAPATGASAGPAVPDAVAFGGSFRSTCAVPNDTAGPKSGWYTCTHTARALGCAGVADGGAARTTVKACRADLTRGTTRGMATHTAAGLASWTCENGVGAGTVAYQPSPGEATFRIPVSLVVIGHTVVVNGSYMPRGTRRTMVVRARFPAVCASGTQVHGYEGSITPV